jgi:uncharacterized membrane protein YdjX (TVP38/TMEM64 family)
MALSLTEHIAVEEITAQAREVHFWRTVLTVIAAVLFGLGWITAKVLSGLWLGLAWSFVAVREGWREGRRSAVSRGTA